MLKNSTKASARLVRTSPRKVNEVLKMVRNMKASQAIVQLSFSKKRIARDVKKLVQSAVANAANNDGYDIDSLYITEATVGKAMVMKRIRARAKGRAARIHKFFSNIYITVTEIEEI